MEIKLSPELERKVHERAGEPSALPSDVVTEALRSFFGPDSLSEAEIEDLNRSIAPGLRDVGSGQRTDGEASR